MAQAKAELQKALQCPEFPRSAKYDPEWVIQNTMGPNVLWLTESLAQVMQLEPGMRVLDMGCGRAISSVFLAREYDLQVWAADLWVAPSENWQRVQEAGLEDRVFPIYAEARALPFAAEFFDAILSLDSYHYFGTDDMYLGSHFAHLVKPGGQIGIVVPALVQESPAAEIPPHLAPYWEFSMNTLHSPDWWRRHWELSGLVTVDLADLMPNGWKHWLTTAELLAERITEVDFGEEAEMLRRDGGRNLGFTRMVARRNPAA